MEARRKMWKPVEKIDNARGVLAKYANAVKSAHVGAITA